MSSSDIYITLFEFKTLEPLNFEENGGNSFFEKKCLEILTKSTNETWMQLGNLQMLGKVGLSVAYASNNGTSCTIRFYKNENVLTVDIQELKRNTLFTRSVVQNFLRFMEVTFKLKPVRQVPTKIPRVTSVPQLFFSSNERVAVYDFNEILCDVDSKFQNIKVLTSTEFGNVLVLDNFINLAENDLIYTHQIIWKGSNNYSGKDVLILGGGDGGILNELLKENPKFVTMIEIDETVMEMCSKFLRGACGSCLDKPRKGSNYEVIVDDCFVQLENFIKQGKSFDVVISDLTDVPLLNDSEEKHFEFWDLMKRTLDKSLSVLNPGGIFLTHLVGLTAVDVVDNYEKLLKSWPIPLNFKRTEAMVPSFMEYWTFYMIYPATGEAPSS